MTIRTILNSSDPPFAWLDVVQPTRDELTDIARGYGLHQMSVEDSLEPEHLPKYERIGSTTFIIVRAMDAEAPKDCSTVTEMTRKVAIFYGTDFLITIHRTEQPFLSGLKEKYEGNAIPVGASERRKSYMPRLLIELINGAIETYEKPLEKSEAAIDAFEATVFGDAEFSGTLHGVYLVKRRVTQMRRMLSHTLDAVQKLVPASEPTAPLYQDIRENAQSMHAYADELLEEVNSLLSIQLALASHRTNEVVRVLTVFSVFFLPLTFIVGIYGMNFEFMPELKWHLGYPLALLLMVISAVLPFVYFKRRGWL